MKLTSTHDSPVINSQGCNDSHPPLSVIDTTSFTVETQFNPQRTYSVPEAVYKVVGGDYRGLSSMKGPKDGFNNSQLDAIFSKTVPKVQQPTSFPSAPAATGSGAANAPVTTATANSVSLPTAAVAGIAAGAAVLFTLALAVTAFVFIMRHKRRKRMRQSDTNNAFGGKAELPSSESGGIWERFKPLKSQGHVRLHEADGGKGTPLTPVEVDGVGNIYEVESPAAIRMVELNAENPFETGGRELSQEEAKAYLKSREGAKA